MIIKAKIIKNINWRYHLYSQKSDFITKNSLLQKKFTIVMFHFKSKNAKNHIIFQIIGIVTKNIIDKNQNNIASGILHETSKFEIGEIIDNCQKENNITGKVKNIAENVIVIAFLISKKFGKNEKILLKNFSV